MTISNRVSIRPDSPEAKTADSEGRDRILAAFEQSDGISADDPIAMESALSGQAAALDVMFKELAKRSARTNWDCSIAIYLRFALKAQAQCRARATVETLAGIRSPHSAALFDGRDIGERAGQTDRPAG